MLQHLTGGGWGLVIRRVLEAATRTLPLMAVLFMPVMLGAHSIYHEWTDHEEARETSGSAVQDAVFEPAVLHGARCDLFRRFGSRSRFS